MSLFCKHFPFLPPLLYSSAWLTSWQDFRANLRPIIQLSIFLSCPVDRRRGRRRGAFSDTWMPWAVAFVLGAIVSPTDAVAATAIVQQLGVPQRVITILEGESLVNDATGLVTYRFAVAAVATSVLNANSTWKNSGWQAKQ